MGSLVALSEAGDPLVNFPANRNGAATAARSTVAISRANLGCEVVLMFDRADADRPIIIGLLRPSAADRTAVPDVTLDGERLVLSADRELVLRCGDATIILTRAGKVLIRGSYLLTRSSGVNRIKGGAVQIN